VARSSRGLLTLAGLASSGLSSAIYTVCLNRNAWQSGQISNPVG
jgi:hypothetical protein